MEKEIDAFEKDASFLDCTIKNTHSKSRYHWLDLMANDADVDVQVSDEYFDEEVDEDDYLEQVEEDKEHPLNPAFGDTDDTDNER